MANLLLCYQNRADDSATVTSSLSGGSWETNLPLANLKRRSLAHVARSTDVATTSTTMQLDMGANRKIGVVALVKHTISLNGQVRVRLAEDSDLSNVTYDSGWLSAWPDAYPASALEWEDDIWWFGRFSLEDASEFPISYILRFAPADARYIQIDIDDTGNAAGYVQIARLWADEGWQPGVNMSYGAGLMWESRSQQETALGGVSYFDRREPVRVMRFDLGILEPHEAYTRALEIQRRCDTSGEVLVLPDPDDNAYWFRTAFLGRMRQLSMVEQFAFNLHRTGFEIEEVK